MNAKANPSEAFFEKTFAWKVWPLTFILLPFGHTLLGLLLLAGGWVVHAVKTRRPALLLSDCRYAYLAVVGLALGALFSLRPAISWAIVAAQLFALLVLFQGGYWLARSQGEERSPWRDRFLPVLAWSSAASWLYAIATYVIGPPESGRVGTLFTGFMGLGSLLILVGVLVFGYLEERESRWRWAYLLLAIVALALTFSRGPLLAFVVAIALYGRATPMGRRLLLWTVLMGAVVVVALLFVPDVRAFIVERITAGDNGRFGIWRTTIAIIAAHPWFGVGPGVHPFVYDEYLVPGAMPHAGHAHNMVLGFLADLGLVGGALFLVFVGMIAVRAWRLLGHDRPLERALAASLIGFLVHQLTDFTMYSGDASGIFWIWSGLVWGSYELWARSEESGDLETGPAGVTQTPAQAASHG